MHPASYRETSVLLLKLVDSSNVNLVAIIGDVAGLSLHRTKKKSLEFGKCYRRCVPPNYPCGTRFESTANGVLAGYPIVTS